MSHEKPDRRTVLRLGLGAAGTLTAGTLTTGSPAHAAVGACEETPQEIIGPFYPLRSQADTDVDLTRIAGHEGQAEGQVFHVRGRVLDDDCQPIPEALVEIWQANARGRYAHERDPNPATPDPHFQGWGRTLTATDGSYGFKTIKPGAYPFGPDQMRTPHIHFKVARRGFHELITQMYWAGEELNAKDFYVQRLSDAERSRVVIRPETVDGVSAPVLHFDITLQRLQSVDAQLLESYVGTYEVPVTAPMLREAMAAMGMAADSLTLKITREGEQLYAENVLAPRVEIRPLGSDRFSYKALDAVVTFQRGGDGRVDGLVLSWNIDQPEMPGRRTGS